MPSTDTRVSHIFLQLFRTNIQLELLLMDNSNNFLTVQFSEKITCLEEWESVGTSWQFQLNFLLVTETQNSGHHTAVLLHDKTSFLLHACYMSRLLICFRSLWRYILTSICYWLKKSRLLFLWPVIAEPVLCTEYVCFGFVLASEIFIHKKQGQSSIEKQTVS